MRRSSMLASVLAVGLLALTGCGSDSLDSGEKKGGGVTASVDKEAAALVPKEIKDKGTLTIGTDASYAPSEFLGGDGKTIEGFDVDLFTAVAKKLDLKAEFVNAKFDSIITGVQGGKYDVGVSSFTVNADRMKQANMVSYFNAGTQWASAPGNPKKIDVDKPRRRCHRAPRACPWTARPRRRRPGSRRASRRPCRWRPRRWPGPACRRRAP